MSDSPTSMPPISAVPPVPGEPAIPEEPRVRREPLVQREPSVSGEPSASDPPPASQTALPADYQRGLIQRRRVLGDAWVDRSLANSNDFNAEFQQLITRHAWNDIWGRPALGDKTRRYMVLSMMLGIHAYDEFEMHVRAALDGPPESRLTPEDIKEALMMAAIYCGVPVANHAFGIAARILREKGLLAPAKAPGDR